VAVQSQSHKTNENQSKAYAFLRMLFNEGV